MRNRKTKALFCVYFTYKIAYARFRSPKMALWKGKSGSFGAQKWLFRGSKVVLWGGVRVRFYGGNVVFKCAKLCTLLLVSL